MNALDILRADHQRIAELFDQWELAQDGAERRRIFEQARLELELHSYLEETAFYPTFSEVAGFRDLIAASYDEHQEMNDLLGEISETQDTEEWEARIVELMSCV